MSSSAPAKHCFRTARVMRMYVLQQLRPNPSLNADVPRAGLRPGSGPPVSLVR